MPIYEFRCGECRKKFEKIVLSGDVPATAECPKCGKKGAERQASRFATASKSGGDDWGSDFGGDEADEGGGYGDDEAMGGMDDDASDWDGEGDTSGYDGDDGGEEDLH